MSLDLNEQQKKAVYCDDKRICVVAGAGSGKTATLIQRIGRLIQEDKCRGDNILALTFTNAAAFEMKERFQKAFGTLNKGVPFFGTFHAFCYSLIAHDIRVRDAVGYTKVPMIVTENKMKMIEKEVATRLGINLTEEKLTTGKNLSPKEEYDYAIFKKALPSALPAFLKNYFVIASLGFVRSVAIDKGMLSYFAVLLYIVAIGLVLYLLRKDWKNPAAWFMIFVLVLICGTVFGTSIMIECISRYMIYNLPLFYIAGMTMLEEIRKG